MAKVSICIPAYNNAAMVRRLLESVEKQTWEDYEVIITDDSDGDEVGKLAEEKGYVRYYKNEVPLGAAANWNEAVGKSSGEYVKIMHHDDWFTDENSLGAFVDMLEQHPEADLAFSGSRQEEAGRSYDRCISADDAALVREDYRNLFLGNTIGAPSAVIVRRKALEEEPGRGIIYDEALAWLVDMEYYMHILKGNPKFVYTEKPLVSIGVGENQLTEACRDDQELNAFEYGYIYQKYHLGEKEECRRKLARILADAGKGVQEAGNYGIGREEYQEVKRKKLWSAIQWKVTHLLNRKDILFLFVLWFVLSLLPLLYLSPVNHATGDDLGYGRLTHEAWVETHSLAEVVKAAGRTVRDYYYGLQGTWTSIFLFTLQPEVFSPEAYIIVPFLMLALWLGATWILGHYLLVRKAGFSKTYFGILYLLFATAGIQYVPSTKSAIFWYNGTAHYTVPYAIALLSLYFYFRFVDGEEKQGRGSYVGMAVCMALLGGCSYQPVLLAPMVMVLLSMFRWGEEEKRKRLLLCLLPLALEMAGLIVSMKAPGNKVRGGEDFGFSMSAAVQTVLSCFVTGAVQAWDYMREHPLLLLFFAAAAVVVWRVGKDGEEGRKYPLPGLFVLFSYCVYCAVFAPPIYAGVEVSGGVYNMNYYAFLYMVFADIIYIGGAFSRKRSCAPGGKDMMEGGSQRIWGRKETAAAAVMAVLALGYLFVFRSDVKTMTTWRTLEYIVSGRAADYKEQIELQRSVLLDDSIKDVVLPFINDDQGPLMHMPLMEDPDAWTNTVTKLFYGKDSVVAIPREVWNELQGK